MGKDIIINLFRNILASALKSCIIPFFYKNLEKNILTPEKVKKIDSFRAKNLSVNT